MSRYQERTCWTRSVSYIEHADYTELGKARAEWSGGNSDDARVVAESYGHRFWQLRYHWLVEDANVIPVAICVLLVAFPGGRWSGPGPFFTTKAFVVIAFGYEKLLEVRSAVQLPSADCVAFQPEMATAVAAAKAVLVHPQSAHLHSLHGVEFLVAYSTCLRVRSSWKLLQARAWKAWIELPCNYRWMRGGLCRCK